MHLALLGRPSARPEVAGEEAPADVEAGLQITAAAGLLVSALIHFAVVDQHLEEWAISGLFFVAIGVVQVALAGAVLLRGRPHVYRLVILIGLGTVGLWAESRTLGVPIGPEAWRPEPVGGADLISTAAEVATAGTLLVALALARTPSDTRAVLRRPLPVVAQGVLLAGLIALTGWFVGAGLEAARRDAHAHRSLNFYERPINGYAPDSSTRAAPAAHGH